MYLYAVIHAVCICICIHIVFVFIFSLRRTFRCIFMLCSMRSVFVFVFILYLYLYFLFEEGSDVSLCCDPCGLVLPPSLHGPSLFSWLDGPVRRGLPPLNLSHNKYFLSFSYLYFDGLNRRGLPPHNPYLIKYLCHQFGNRTPGMKSGQYRKFWNLMFLVLCRARAIFLIYVGSPGKRCIFRIKAKSSCRGKLILQPA